MICNSPFITAILPKNRAAKIPAVSKISIHDQQLNGTENAEGVLGTQNKKLFGLEIYGESPGFAGETAGV